MSAKADLLRDLGELPGNELSLDLLCKQLQTSVGVIPFIGAGTSMDFGFPSWTNFLLKLAQEAGIEPAIRQHIGQGHYEEAAEELLKTLRFRRFQDLFVSEFGNHRIEGKQLKGAVCQVPRLSSGPVITTNFDHVLERVFEQAGFQSEVVLGARADKVVTGLHQNASILLKIHGDVAETTDRILTLGEYKNHYGDTEPAKVDLNRSLPRLLKLMLSSRPVLFIGCSLNQDRTVSLLLEVARDLPDVAHYAIVEKPDDEAAYRKKDRYLSDQGIRPIWFLARDKKGATQFHLIQMVLNYLADAIPEAFRRRANNTVEVDARRDNLPDDLSSFVGRETDVQAVKALLESDRLVTLAGAGGCGKTRLAIHVARQVLDRYKDGVWLVKLASIRDKSLVPQTVAKALGLKEQAPRPPTQALADYLTSKELLLVIDNCEHLVDACADLVKELLEASGRLRVLVTSRQTLDLKLAGESVYRVSPLGTPDLSKLPRFDRLDQFDAVRLFVARAKLSITEENAPAIAEICHRLDGIPLALELAAARLDGLSVQEIAQNLHEAFRMLTGGDRTILPQHQTLRATMDWSYDLLSQEQQRLLRALSVFDGGCTWEAASAVCGSDTADKWVILDQLKKLVDRSMVVSKPQHALTRYQLLETIRQYALEKLTAAGEDKELKCRHRDWFLALAELAEPELLKSEQDKWLDWLETDHDNLRAALTWSAANQETDFALRLGAALWRFWEMRGYLTEGRQRLAKLLALPDSPLSEATRSKVLSGAGMLAYRQGNAQAAHDLFTRALAIERRRQDPSRVAVCLNDLGIASQLRGEFQQAHDYYEESLKLAKQSGTQRDIGVALFNIGNAAYRLGQFDKASRVLPQSLKLFEDDGNLDGCAFSLHVLGMLALHRGDEETARSNLQKSYDLRKKLGNKRGMSDSLSGLARAALLRGETDTAHSRLAESLILRRELDDARGTAETLESFVVLAVEQGQMLRAVQISAAAAELRNTIGVPRSPIEHEEQDRCMKRARAVLGGDALEQARSIGRSLPLDQVVRVAQSQGMHHE